MSDGLEAIAARLIEQRDEPLDETARVHYWRDKAITAAGQLEMLALSRTTGQGGDVGELRWCLQQFVNAQQTGMIEVPADETIALVTQRSMKVLNGLSPSPFEKGGRELPLLESALLTTQAGPSGHLMKFWFPDLDTLEAAEKEWRAAMRKLEDF